MKRKIIVYAASQKATQRREIAEERERRDRERRQQKRFAELRRLAWLADAREEMRP